MANPVSAESETIAKRIIIGVLTAVVTSAVIYLLGFNRSSEKASRAEIKKNTIAAWKTFVKLENELQPKHDSNFVRMQRGQINISEYRKQEKLTSEAFIAEVSELKGSKNIDRDFTLLLEDRIEYKQQEMLAFQLYGDRFQALQDTITTPAYKNYLIEELNKEFNAKKVNLVERLGRNIESLAAPLSRKYKYLFQVSDFNFNDYYQMLKNSKKVPYGPQEGTDLPE